MLKMTEYKHRNFHRSYPLSLDFLAIGVKVLERLFLLSIAKRFGVILVGEGNPRWMPFMPVAQVELKSH
ncbi:MAG: hypothetical protein AAF228_08470 [Pseudomonadota bacterium]